MSSEFSDDWQTYLEGALNKRCVAYLEQRFKRRGITQPELKHIQVITIDELVSSQCPISMKCVYELSLFIQELNEQQ